MALVIFEDLPSTNTPINATNLNKIQESDIYSTNEIEIGKWIDGKPIYRKCFSGTTSNTVNNILTIDNLDKIVDQGGFVVYTGGYQFPVPSAFGQTEVNDVRIIKMPQEDKINLQTGSNMFNQHYEIWIEYTKTTD